MKKASPWDFRTCPKCNVQVYVGALKRHENSLPCLRNQGEDVRKHNHAEAVARGLLQCGYYHALFSRMGVTMETIAAGAIVPLYRDFKEPSMKVVSSFAPANVLYASRVQVLIADATTHRTVRDEIRKELLTRKYTDDELTILTLGGVNALIYHVVHKGFQARSPQ